jgi:hypothetical protein
LIDVFTSGSENGWEQREAGQALLQLHPNIFQHVFLERDSKQSEGPVQGIYIESDGQWFIGQMWNGVTSKIAAIDNPLDGH